MRFGSEFKLALLLGLALLVLPAGATDRYPAQYLGGYSWHEPNSWFGGFSAIEIREGGAKMLVLSDRATLLSANIHRASGRISGVEAGVAYPIKSSKGTNLVGRVVDSEGLAVGRDGTLFISFEGVSRVVQHTSGQSAAKVLPRPQVFRDLPLNKSLESLAIDARGNLYTLPENALTADRRIPVYKWNGSNWSTPFTLPRRGGYLPVSADIGPDERFYLLERNFTVLGFRSRLRRWDMNDGAVHNETVLLQTGRGTHDNLEGLSIWRDDSNHLRATMISDDNFNLFQKTELVEYALPD
jgi:hypothetical protein